MRICQAEASDLDAICEVIEDGRAALKELGIDQWQKSSPSKYTLEGDIDSGQGFVAVDGDGAVVGYMMLNDAGEIAYDDVLGGNWVTFSNSASPRYLAVHRVAVRDSAKGKGVGKFMLSEAQRIARERGLESVRIDTHEGNTVMRGLLKSLGFTQCGTILLVPGTELTRERIAYEKVV